MWYGTVLFSGFGYDKLAGKQNLENTVVLGKNGEDHVRYDVQGVPRLVPEFENCVKNHTKENIRCNQF